MKTGEIGTDSEVGDAGGAGQFLAVDGWSPWLNYLPEDGVDAYYRAANACMSRLDRMPPAVRAQLIRVTVRCPCQGCRLADIYELPDSRSPDADRPEGRSEGTYLYVGRTAGRTEVYDILNYLTPSTPKDERFGCACHRILYWRAGCRHGTASLDRSRLYDMIYVAHGRIGPWATEEQAIAHLPEHLRRHWGKRVFHPAPEAWHPKKRSNRRARVLP